MAAESGTDTVIAELPDGWNELMARGGYAELFTLQSRAYLDGDDELSQLGPTG